MEEENIYSPAEAYFKIEELRFEFYLCLRTLIKWKEKETYTHKI